MISLLELGLSFLRLGAVAFGGPQAHMALLRETFVEQRLWVKAEDFEEGLALCEALPGPASSQMAIFLGWRCRGVAGGLVSGLGFLLPGLLVVLVLSALWRSSSDLGTLRAISSVIQPVVAAVIWAFAGQLLQLKRTDWELWGAGLVFVMLAACQLRGVNAPLGLVLLASGLLRMAWHQRTRSLFLAPWLGLELLVAAQLKLHLLAELFDVFLRAGLLIFGGGFVIIPLLEGPVLDHGWMSSGAFLDGIAIGQLSPGPVVLTSAFVGFQAGANLAGGWFAIAAALVATTAIFLPSFAFILAAAPLIERIRTRPMVQAFRDGVIAAVPAVVAAAALRLSLDSLHGVGQCSVLLLALLLRLQWKISPVPLLLGAAGFGLLLGR
jgi:chromate transporter